MVHDNCLSCSQAPKVDALTSRMDKLEIKTDSLHEIIKTLQSTMNKAIFMLVSALGITILQLLILLITKK